MRQVMLYGVCTWIFGDEPLSSIFQRVARMGFDGVELLGDYERHNPRTVRTLLDAHGLKVFSLTPLDVDLAHPDPKIRNRALEYYLRLLDFAAEIGAPVVTCHGAVGRTRPIATLPEEEDLFLEGVIRIAERASVLGIKVALETLNRYESHLLNTTKRIKSFLARLNSPAVGILLDTYHMNIEEEDLISAIWEAQEHLILFHVADSNRRGLGKGHIPFIPIFRALRRTGYRGPVIVECTAPGPDPFSPQKGPGWKEALLEDIEDSLRFLNLLESLGS